MVRILKNTLEKILNEANSIVGNTLYSAVEKASLKVLHNGSYGLQLIALNYISFSDGKFVSKYEEIPSPAKVSAQYVAKKLLDGGAIYTRSSPFADENCSMQSARQAFKYLKAARAVKIHRTSRQGSVVTYKIINRKKLEQISEGNFT
jgi:hypothetical protein